MEKFNLKGTKTEKNLQEAFAGESMARNKYTYYASKAMFPAQQKTCWTQHRVKTTNGQTCMTEWRKKLEKKVSTASHTCLKQ